MQTPIPEDPTVVTPAAASTPGTERDLRAIVADGVFFSLMIGLGEAYVPAFALAIGLGDVAAGLIATLPMLLGAVLQLVTPFAVRHLRSYRRWVVLCAGLQAATFLPLAFGAVTGRVGLAGVAAATVGYWAFGMATGPAWNAWITSLVPAPVREEFFARRTRAAQAALLVALVGGGLALEAGRRHALEMWCFGALFVGAFAARMLSTRALASQSERPDLAEGFRALGPVAVWRRLRGADSLRVLRYLLAMQVVANVAAPFFTPYMLNHLALSYGEFMVLTAAAFVARVAILPLLGRVAREVGARRLLWLGGVGIVPLPVLWLVSDAFGYLLCVQLLAGCAWAAVELATTLSYFEGIEESDRASVLTAFNFANALAIAVGSLLGAQLLGWLDESAAAYLWLFVVSSGGRLLAAGLLRSTPAPGEVWRGLRLRTLAVRPLGGTVQRPILATLPEQPASPEAPGIRSRKEGPECAPGFAARAARRSRVCPKAVRWGSEEISRRPEGRSPRTRTTTAVASWSGRRRCASATMRLASIRGDSSPALRTIVGSPTTSSAPSVQSTIVSPGAKSSANTSNETSRPPPFVDSRVSSSSTVSWCARPRRIRYARLSPMCPNTPRSPRASSIVTVVARPVCSGASSSASETARSAYRIAASTTARATRSRLRSSSSPEISTSSSSAFAAVRAATSPAGVPLAPSHTT